MTDQPNVPPAGQGKTITATMKIATIVDIDPVEFEKKVNEFLETIDNQTRFLNARNVYSMRGENGVDKLVAVVWYLQRLAEEAKAGDKPAETPAAQPLGGEAKNDAAAEQPGSPGNNQA